MEAFVADSSPDAWPNLIDSLLESKHYGERWARHWLDVARYADSGGYETDIYYRNAWRYRDYVVRSFNNDKPYDVFVQEQIAGDELWPDNLDLDPRQVYVVTDEKKRHLDTRIATGFYSLQPRVHESGLDAKRLAYETMTDWVDATASAFMGLTLGCARCHDHKFDPFTQQDYFALHAIFASAREVELPLWTSVEEADWRQNFPKILAVEEARTAYLLFQTQTSGQELAAVQRSRQQELLAAIGQAVVNLPKTAAQVGPEVAEYAALMQVPVANVLGRQHPALIRTVHLLERGVRYVQLVSNGWAAHSNNKERHEAQAKKTDQPIAGLISDLHQRGLLESTLLVWVGEFGRTPIRQRNNSRDHHPYGFSAWMAGGGIVGGKTIGATDDLGFNAIEDKVHVNDLHATILGLMGIDHEELEYLFDGRFRRLTDVSGKNNLAPRLVRG